MTTLLDAARQALPGLEWETDGESAVCRVSSAPHESHLSPLRGTNPELVFCGSDGYGAWARFRSIDEAAQWLRAQVTDRRDALDAALGEQHIGTSAREAWVPVTERLPPMGQEVDLWDGSGRLPDYHRDGDADLWEWFNAYGEPIGDVPGAGEPTHWRSKPWAPVVSKTERSEDA